MSNISCEIISTITSANKSTWNEFIVRSPFTSIYYRYEFLQAVEEGTHYEPRHIVATKDDNIIGVFPNFIQPIPHLPFKILFSMDPGFGGPLINKNENQAMPLMIDQIKNICKRTILAHYIQTQHPGFIRYHHFLLQQGYRLNIRYSNDIIPLKDRTYTDIKKQYYSGRIHELNKMKNKNLRTIDEQVTTDSLTTFYKEYIQTMHRVGGTPYPLQLLLSINKYLPNRLKLITVSLNEENIGKHLYLIDKERNMLIVWLIAIKPEYHQYYPSTLIHDFMIQWALQNTFYTYDLGYTLADFQDTLFQYKEQFGVTTTPILTWEKSYSAIPINLIKIGGKLYKKYFRSER
jgi:predicted N-acyltransferase